MKKIFCSFFLLFLSSFILLDCNKSSSNSDNSALVALLASKPSYSCANNTINTSALQVTYTSSSSLLNPGSYGSFSLISLTAGQKIVFTATTTTFSAANFGALISCTSQSLSPSPYSVAITNSNHTATVTFTQSFTGMFFYIASTAPTDVTNQQQ